MCPLSHSELCPEVLRVMCATFCQCSSHILRLRLMPTVDARPWAEGFVLGLKVLSQQQVLEDTSGPSGVCHVHARGPYPHAHHHPPKFTL